MKKRKMYSQEERVEFMNKINAIRKTDNLSIEEACQKAGLHPGRYYHWNRKSKTKRNKKQPVLVTSLVPAQPDQNLPQKPNTHQIAEILSIMNANSLRILLENRSN